MRKMFKLTGAAVLYSALNFVAQTTLAQPEKLLRYIADDEVVHTSQPGWGTINVSQAMEEDISLLVEKVCFEGNVVSETPIVQQYIDCQGFCSSFASTIQSKPAIIRPVASLRTAPTWSTPLNPGIFNVLCYITKAYVEPGYQVQCSIEFAQKSATFRTSFNTYQIHPRFIDAIDQIVGAQEVVISIHHTFDLNQTYDPTLIDDPHTID